MHRENGMISFASHRVPAYWWRMIFSENWGLFREHAVVDIEAVRVRIIVGIRRAALGLAAGFL